MIAIVDYGVGNLFSLKSSLDFLGFTAFVTNKIDDIKTAEQIILPGVGAYGDAMEKLNNTGLIPTLKEQAQNGKPFLGICLGMQLLFDESFEYGNHKGLGLIKGKVVSFEGKIPYKIPHMGWNSLNIVNNHPILKNNKQGDYMYFVHSFYADDCEESLCATAEYGIAVPALVAKDNIIGAQFHPEKSGKAGLSLLNSFCNIKTL